MTTIIRTQAEISDASNQVLVDTYNSFTGKNIKKFSSRAAGEAQVSNAILKGLNDAAHAGVAKGVEPTAMTAAETEVKASSAAAAAPPTEEKETQMTAKETRDAVRAKRYPSEAKKAKAAPVAARKMLKKAKAAPVAAKKAKAAPADKRATYAYIRLTKPNTFRRPQPGSKRTAVLTAIQAAFADKTVKRLAIEDLSKKLKFDVRSYVHKLAATGWVEVVGA